MGSDAYTLKKREILAVSHRRTTGWLTSNTRCRLNHLLNYNNMTNNNDNRQARPWTCASQLINCIVWERERERLVSRLLQCNIISWRRRERPLEPSPTYVTAPDRQTDRQTMIKVVLSVIHNHSSNTTIMYNYRTRLTVMNDNKRRTLD